MLTIASWNVNSIRARLDHLRRWLGDNSPDIVALQETKTVDDDFPRAALEELGYHVTCCGQRSYNGVAVLSREPPRAIFTAIPAFEDEQRRVLGVVLDDLLVLNLYVPNGAAVGTDKYHYKLAWLDALIPWLESLLAAHPALVVLGDFNVAPDDRDVHDPEAWRGQILCSEEERARVHRMLALGLVDTFRLFEQEPGAFSWWDYRQGAFRRNRGLRIDLLLASPPLALRCLESTVDRAPRTWERPSDHAPVVARFGP